jgi:predicted dehydrogenase
MNTFRWGIIGPGSIAKEFAHDIKLIRSARHEISAVLSHRAESAAAFAEEEHVPAFYTDMELFLDEGGMDAVYIATPHPFHYRETMRCLQRKVPVLCEKPMGMNQEQVKDMIARSQETNTFLMEGMWIRFLPSIAKVLSLISENTIGTVLSVKADMSYKAPRDMDSRYFDPHLGGGSLLDLGIYPISLVLLVLGRPDELQSWARLSKDKIDESCVALFQYPNGIYATVESSLVMQTGLTAVIYGSTGKIHILRPWNEKPERIVVEMYDGQTQEYPCEWEGRGLQFEAEEAYHCIKTGKTESEKVNHAFSEDLIELMDIIRRQTGIVYPADL